MKSYSNFARGKNSSNIVLKYTSRIIEISSNCIAEMLRENGENHDFRSKYVKKQHVRVPTGNVTSVGLDFYRYFHDFRG